VASLSFSPHHLHNLPPVSPENKELGFIHLSQSALPESIVKSEAGQVDEGYFILAFSSIHAYSS
jgi:hypothetical protein